MPLMNVKVIVRGSIVTVAILTLVYIGSVSIGVSFGNSEGEPGNADRVSRQLAFVSITLLENADSMEKTEPAGSGKSVYLCIPAMVGGQSLDNIKPDSKIIEYRATEALNVSRFDYLTTTALISSKKALEFTLVGAKPSGTS
jgi:hypothetical protein